MQSRHLGSWLGPQLAHIEIVANTTDVIITSNLAYALGFHMHIFFGVL